VRKGEELVVRNLVSVSKIIAFFLPPFFSLCCYLLHCSWRRRRNFLTSIPYQFYWQDTLYFNLFFFPLSIGN